MRDWRTVQGKSISLHQREFLVRLAEETCITFPKPVIVNIGVHVGCSLYCLHAGCPHAKLIGVDINEKWLTPSKKEIARLILGDSNLVHTKVRKPIHLLFIDGGHSYHTVKGDINGWVPELVVGGIVAFHDLHLAPVQRAFREWYDSESWEEIPDPPCKGFRAFRRIE